MLATLGGLLVLSACTANTSAAGDAIAVNSGDDVCEVAASEAPSGTVQFTVKNTGSQVTEFYVLADDGLQILSEVENIGPGLARDLVVQLPPGTVKLACKPGMVGDGIRSDFTVLDSGSDTTFDEDEASVVDAATTNYAAYVKDQTEQLLADTKAFAAAYIAGDDDAARALYAPTRMHWERIEPVAESFGDLDPILDAREADLEEGQEWTGWHRIEKDLWPPASGYTALTPAQRTKVAEQLVADTQTLYDRTRDMTFTVDKLGNGAKELLDEVATGKITGEEEIWSHTDLWDFQANLEGAKVMYAGLRPVVQKREPELAATLDEQFDSVQKKLDKHREGDGFVYYTDLTPAQVKELAEAVDALAEPLSRLTTTVLLGGQQS
ncbi:MAG: iron uptake system protein EfeO [Candidatus Nanopelagicales bacterium]